MAIVEVQDKDAVCEPLISIGLIAVQYRPAGSGVSVRVTVPVKPFWGLIEIVDDAEVVPSAGVEAGGVAAMV